MHSHAVAPLSLLPPRLCENCHVGLTHLPLFPALHLLLRPSLSRTAVPSSIMEVASPNASPEKPIHNEQHAPSGHAVASKDASSSPAKGQQGQPAARLDSHMSRHTYHGHRRASFITKDIDELTELRARRESSPPRPAVPAADAP